MSEQAKNVDEHALTMMWETLGIEDRNVEEARTMTMRSDFRPSESSPDAMVQKLPALLRNGKAGTLPELRIKGTLGEGGMGLVELAEQLSLGRDVAVKKVREDSKSDRATLVLLREGWTTGLLEHPNIVPVYTLGRNDDGDPVIVMKKIAGTSWLDIIKDLQAAPETFDADDPIELHIEVLVQVCNAIHYAHSRGIIHRDLKPENVMLGSFGEVYVLDWGIAVSLNDDPTGRLAQASDVDKPAGTPAYMAPEMVDADGDNLGIHTDIFLLGAMLYEALMGQPPYSGKSLFAIMMSAHECEPPHFDDTVPAGLVAICHKAMAREPGDRFQSVRALRDALQDFRRHRESHRLAAKGAARLDGVCDFLRREDEGQIIDETALYRTFGECRFAYEQSLEITPDNAEAVQGLQKALELMADRALNRDALKAASLLIADFPRQNEDFQRRLADLEERLATRREDYEELQQIRDSVDAEIGRRSRTIFLLIMGGIWIVLSFAYSIIISMGIWELTQPRMFGRIAVMTGVLAIVLYAGRRIFFGNELNRRMLMGVLVIFGSSVVLRGIAWAVEMPLMMSLTMEFMLYAVGLFMLALTLDRRLVLGGIPYLLAAVAGAIWPSETYWFLAIANAAAVSVLVWLWWPTDSGEGICEVSESLR